MPRMALDEFDPEEFLHRKLEEIPATDLAILTMGGILGSQGYTPLTALIKLIIGPVGSAAVSAQSKAAQAGVPPWLFWLAPMPSIFVELFGVPKPPANASEGILEGFREMMLLAMTGAIESYALTRPGVVTGLAQAAGLILPG